MITIRDLTKFYGHQDVFRNCDLHIGLTDRIGLVGPNGAGKTTLFRLILGEEEPSRGEISKPKGVRIGYLPQSMIRFKGKTVLRLVTDTASGLKQIQRELQEVASALEKAQSHEEMVRLTERQGRLHESFDRLGGYGLEGRAKKVLMGLGFSAEDFNRPIDQLSGGWGMRAVMARILLSRPDLILLDEPTNHLDLDSLIWMEDYLKENPSALVLASHDRVFLNNVVNRIVEIDGGRLISYPGIYDDYEKEREKRLRIQQAAYETQQEKIRQIERFIERNRARKDRAKQVQGRIRMLEKMERIDPPMRQHTVDFDFPEPPRAPKILLELENVSKSYGAKRIYDRIALSIQRGDRIAFLGPNGTGKTTLMRILRKEVDFDGERLVGAGVHVAAFSQEQMDLLLPHHTILQELTAVAGDRTQGQLRSLLGAFLFEGDDVFKRVSILSGGEKSRLILSKILVQPANLLLLDEPTNHLDIPSRKILEIALQHYRGSLCLVTHDRHLINAVASKILVIRNQKVEIFPGNFDDYQSIWRKRESTPSAPQVEARRPDREAPRKKSRAHKQAEAEWRNRLFREATPLRERLTSLGKSIDEATKQLDEITKELAREETYRDPERSRQLGDTYHRMRTQVAEWTGLWESTTSELEKLEKRFGESKPKWSDQKSVARSQESE